MEISKSKELSRIKDLVEAMYGFSLFKGSRKRKVIYARKVYVKLAKDHNHTYESIGNTIGYSHALIMHHYNSFNVVLDVDMVIYNRFLNVYKVIPKISDKELLSIPFNEETEEVMVRAEYEILIEELKNKIDTLESDAKRLEVFAPMLKLCTGWSKSDRLDFIQYRMKPYSDSIKNKKY